MSDTDKRNNEDPSRKGGLGRAFLSVAAAAFGVQSDKNRSQDFSQSSPWPYIIAGVIFTLVFIGVLVVVVNLVLS